MPVYWTVVPGMPEKGGRALPVGGRHRGGSMERTPTWLQFQHARTARMRRGAVWAAERSAGLRAAGRLSGRLLLALPLLRVRGRRRARRIGSRWSLPQTLRRPGTRTKAGASAYLAAAANARVLAHAAELLLADAHDARVAGAGDTVLELQVQLGQGVGCDAGGTTGKTGSPATPGIEFSPRTGVVVDRSVLNIALGRGIDDVAHSEALDGLVLRAGGAGQALARSAGRSSARRAPWGTCGRSSSSG